jgi:PTS system nitrogen regulatory IIA component
MRSEAAAILPASSEPADEAYRAPSVDRIYLARAERGERAVGKLTVRDAAALLNVSEKSVYSWIEQGLLPASRIDDQYRINRTELLEWATARNLHVSPELFSELESEGAPAPTLGDALRAGGIHYRIGGSDKAAVLRRVVEILDLPGDLDREFLYEVLLAREALGSTGVGDGIAIPHVRNPIVLHLARPIVTLCFLERPVDFGALDGRPVHTLFTLISPTVRAHLHLLSRLAFVLRDPRFSAVVRRQAPPDEIHAALRDAETAVVMARPQPASQASRD